MPAGTNAVPLPSGEASEVQRCRIGDLTFAAGPVVSRDGRDIYLSDKEFALLRHLVLNHGRVVSRAELMAHLYPDHAIASANIVEVMVMRLRRKLSPQGEPDMVMTRRGAGYQIIDGGAANPPSQRISPFAWQARAARLFHQPHLPHLHSQRRVVG